jgi:hypothetical protein
VYTGSDTVTLNFIVKSSSAGKLKFSNLYVNYNIPPDQADIIPTQHAYEDTENLNLLNLSTYFSDTDQNTWDLNYTVISNSQSLHVDVFTNDSQILKFRPLTPDWYGETEVMIQVQDSGMKRKYSNPFKIIVHGVNDEPTAKDVIPDVVMYEGEQGVELNLGIREYFTDVDNTTLYYSLVMDPQSIYTLEMKGITADLDPDGIITINGLGDFNTEQSGINYPIPLWVYCDDDPEINTLNDGAGNYVYQELLVTVKPVDDPPEYIEPNEYRTDAPIELRRGIPTAILYEDEIETFQDFLNIYDFVIDDESSESLKLVVTSSNPTMKIQEKGGYLNVTVPENYYGTTDILVQATDDDNHKIKVNFGLEIMAVNDVPQINILSHKDGAEVSGEITLTGNMSDIENTIQLVEIKIESKYQQSLDAEYFDWQQVFMGATRSDWSYIWNTTMVQDGPYKITAKVSDGQLIATSSVLLQIDNNKNLRPEVEILSPDVNAEINGTVIISGSVFDPELQGINELQIRILTTSSSADGEEGVWRTVPLANENATLWSHSWDSRKVNDGPITISVKASDGDLWSIPKHLTVKVSNGINATMERESGPEKEADNFYWFLSLSLIAVIVIISLLLLSALILRGRKKVREYVPEGRVDESLEQVEATLKRELSPAPAMHAPLPAGPAAMMPSAAQLPPPDTMAVVPLGLPAAGGTGVGAGAVAVGPAGLPALPPAAQTSPAPAAAAPAAPAPAPAAVAAPAAPAAPAAAAGGNYGLYSPNPPSATSSTTPVVHASGSGRYSAASPAAPAAPLASAKPATPAKPKEP